MTRTVQLRRWQKDALDLFVASVRRDFLAVATPGAGKTTFALTAARHELGARPTRLVVVAPTAHLKQQWARAAAAFSLHLDPAWSAADGALPGDMHGIVTTYQQVATNAPLVSRLASDAFVVLDELHHAGAERVWGEAIREAFSPARRRLALSGTPFRSDTCAIPFVTYTGEQAVPDYEYGYGDALADRRVVRPVYFPATGGHMEWSGPDGAVHSATFDDRLDTTRSSQRLRTALSLEGEWLPAVLRAAHARLVEVRGDQPDAGGLVIASDREHARGIAALLRMRLGVSARVVTSDDPAASAEIARFAVSSEPWLVAMRLVSEGVDIPRLRVGVYATTTATELFFRQAVGRLVRWTRGVARQRAWLYIPDDPRLRAHAAGIAEQRRHSLRRPERDELENERSEDEPAAGEAEQLSLFAVISAVATGAPEAVGFAGDHTLDEGDDGGDDHVELALAPPPPLTGAVDAGAGCTTRREAKQELRDANARAARELARRTGLTHAEVNAELNRRSGLRRVAEATLLQLDARLDAAERWLVSA
jgi:superfamily II DNA or RNA helicase